MSRLSDALRDKLDLPGVGDGPVVVDNELGSVEVDLSAKGPIGAKVQRVRVESRNPADLREQARRICTSVDIPIIVDADTGYGNPLNVIRTVNELISAGAAGCCSWQGPAGASPRP